MNLDYEDEASVKEWQATNEGEMVLQKEAVLKKKVALLENQADKIANPENDKETNLRRAFTHFFMGAKTGMNLNNPQAKRPVNLQMQFRGELEAVMDLRHPSYERYRWCPIKAEYCVDIIAGHFFPSKSGDENMTAIFGEAELDKWIGKPEKGKSELFRACNGILWSKEAELRFSLGQFVIVPDLEEDATADQAQAWQNSTVKGYRIRVLRPNAKEMAEPMNLYNPTLWKDLDKRRVDFKGSTFRPRARYVYWSYCETMLRHAYSERGKSAPTEFARQEVGKKLWGSAGPYMTKNMLLRFVEEMGHQYEHLLEGAMEVQEGEPEEPVETALWYANESILEKCKTREERAVEEDHNRDEDYDDEDEDYDDSK
ncbi:MAG: hypothetical protein Q9163_001185 [Psora crenata]